VDNARPTALVTGGSRGIGRAIVKRLASAGYDVCFTYHASRSEAASLVAELEGRARIEAVCVDHCDPTQVEQLASSFVATDQLPYALICNAGASMDALSTLTELEHAKDLFQLNFFSCVQLIKAMARPMARRKSGRIVLIGSIASELGSRGNAVYAASKAAMQSYMRNVIEEFAKRGVTANCVRPGMISTDLTAKYTEAQRDASRIPASRFGEPDEVAAVVEFLLSPSAGYVNGACIDVDGGLSATVGLG
jgi:NAD(P)-dependent dehydrogenase (short-subunit alcohol dehydrogenase family)